MAHPGGEKSGKERGRLGSQRTQQRTVLGFQRLTSSGPPTLSQAMYAKSAPECDICHWSCPQGHSDQEENKEEVGRVHKKVSGRAARAALRKSYQTLP